MKQDMRIEPAVSPEGPVPAVRVEGLGKEYRIGAAEGERSSYRSLREEMTKGLTSLGRRRRAPDERFWALKDVSFDIAPGERVGIIGRNGAGKTTLLKILSRITTPTEGRAEIRGRVASLLEVGTGFHPELSGRENIYLSGAIIGMRHAEIRAKTDEIVEFAGIGRFLNTPIKRYSSGMYLRLAFSVAAHLDADVLMVDEVLAVGDADFQKKCLGRMAEIGERGRTIMFVSHSMPAILRLCSRVILLDEGKVIADGSPREAIRTYLDSGLGSTAEREWGDLDRAPGDHVVRLTAARVRTDDGRVSEEIDIRRPVYIEVEYRHMSGDDDLKPIVNLHFYNEDGILLFISGDAVDLQWRHRRRMPGLVKAVCRIPGNFLAEGRISVLAAISTINPTLIHAQERDAVSFQVVDRSVGDGARGEWASEYPGVVRPMLDWTVSHTPEPSMMAGVHGMGAGE